jgi:hypothetical protein
MDSVTTVALTLISVLVGTIIVVLLQVNHALKNLQSEVRDARLKLEPLFDKMNSSSQVATAVAMAVAAGVRAFRDAKDARDREAQAMEMAAAHLERDGNSSSMHDAHSARTYTTTRTREQYKEAVR